MSYIYDVTVFALQHVCLDGSGGLGAGVGPGAVVDGVDGHGPPPAEGSQSGQGTPLKEAEH